MTLNYKDPKNFQPTATYNDMNTAFTEYARITGLSNMEELDKAILRVTGMEGIRSAPNTMKESLLQKAVRRNGEADDADGNPVGSDDTYHDVLFTPNLDEGGSGYRLAMVDSDYMHEQAVANSYRPLPYIGSFVVPAEIEATVATEVSSYVGGATSGVLWEINIDEGGWSTTEFTDETAQTTDVTIASGSEAVIRLTTTNDFGSEVVTQEVTITT